MARAKTVPLLLSSMLLSAVTGCGDMRAPGWANRDQAPPAEAEPAGQPGPAAPGEGATARFVPPDEADIPDGPYGDVVRRGRDIFTNTRKHAADYVGNGLNCSNCHLDAGRRADSAPLWAAYVRYPAYRSKTGQVNTYAERIQGCFLYSMNGKAPAAGSPELVALETYSFWMAQGAPVGAKLPGAGYPKFEPPQAPDYARGEKVFQDQCAVCHGPDGLGQKVADGYAFPPLWGKDSYNWGAGMHQLDNAAAFIKANMPLGRGGSLSDQQAWDVAMFMNAHERPQDPRFTGDVAATRKQFHDDKNSLYGIEINGRVLGQDPAR